MNRISATRRISFTLTSIQIALMLQLLVSSVQGQDLHLVTDFNEGAVESDRDSLSASWVTHNGLSYFTSSDWDDDQSAWSAQGVWVSDGTTANTHMVVNLADGGLADGSSLKLKSDGPFLIIIRDTPYRNGGAWNYNDQTGKTELLNDNIDSDVWVFDGALYFVDAYGRFYRKSEAETQELANLGRGTVSMLHQIDSGFFMATASGLWFSDGSIAGTLALVPGDSFQRVGLTGTGVAVFRGRSPEIHYNYWASDGTTAGTRLLASGLSTNAVTLGDGLLIFESIRLLYTEGTSTNTIVPGGQIIYSGLNFDGEPLFRTESSSSTKIWRTDGTEAGTRAILNTFTEIDTSMAFAASGELIFSADQGIWLYRDGVGPSLIRDGFEQTPSVFASLAGQVLFTGQETATGAELWRTDGTSSGTAILADLNPGPDDLSPSYPVILGDRLVFKGFTDESWTLFSTDGTSAGTFSLQTLSHYRHVFGERMIFLAGETLMITDGTLLGTHALGSFTSASTFATMGDRVFFNGTGAHGREPHVTDGTAAGTYQLHDIGKHTPGGTMGGQVEHNGELAFLYDDQLLMTDGSQLGMHQLASGEMRHLASTGDALYYARRNVPGSTNFQAVQNDGLTEAVLQITESAAQEFQRAGNQVFFRVGDSLWRSDGTVAGTQDLATTATELDVLDNRLYFRGEDLSLWHSDGTEAGTAPLDPDAFHIKADVPELGYLHPTGNHLFFWADTGTLHEYQPWVSDGSQMGTRPLRQSRPVYRSRAGSHLFATMGGLVYFVSHGSQLYATDTTSYGTEFVASLGSGKHIEGLYAFEDALLILVRHGLGHYQLWRSRGTEATTYRLLDFTKIDHPEEGLVVNNILYFSGYNFESGTEPWRSDGTEPGTYMLADLAPGAESSAPADFSAVGSNVFFNAYTHELGRELYRLCDVPRAEIQTEPWLCEGNNDGEAIVANAGGGAEYSWFIENGIITAQLDHWISWEADGSLPVILSVDIIMREGCTAQGEVTVHSLDEPPAPAGAISGPSNVCAFSREVTYQVAEQNETVSYHWTVPAGAVIITGQGSHRIQVNFAEGIGEISVVPSNVCGEGAAASLTVIHQTLPSQADAGDDVALCDDTVTLQANDPGALDGTWSVISGVGGTLTEPATPNSDFHGIRGETYLLRWTLSGSDCQEVFDEVRISFYPQPEAAFAGDDMDFCDFHTNLQANAPAQGSGIWTVVSGQGGTLDDPLDPNSDFTGPYNETFVLLWTVTSGACGESSDTVTLGFYEDLGYVSAGYDTPVAVGTSISLDGDDPLGGLGTWSITDGPELSNSQFGDINHSNSTFTPTSVGEYTLRWAVENGPCPIYEGSVTISADLPERTPQLVVDLRPGSANSYPRSPYVTANGELYFTALDYLYRSDGSPEGTIQFSDLFIGKFVLIGDTLYCAASTYSIYTLDLWRFDLDGNGTHLVDLSWDYIRNLTEYNGKLFFSADDGTHGVEPWISDGTTAGTFMLADINPGWPDSSGSAVALSNVVFWIATNNNRAEAWISDGTSAGTRLLLDTGPYVSNSWKIAVAGGRAYFSANDNLHGREPWVSDGTSAGTQMLADLYPGIISSSPTEFTASGESMYFKARTASGSNRLWVSDASLNVTDLELQAQELGAGINGRLLFGSQGQTWVTDGTVAGTEELTVAGASLGSPDRFWLIGDLVYFTTTGNDLWRSDCTESGTVELMNLPWDAQVNYLVELAGSLYFSADWPEFGKELSKLTPLPDTRITVAETVCTSALQNARVADAGTGATYTWAISGGEITAGEGETEITFRANGTGPVTLTVDITKQSGIHDRGECHLNADPISLELWENPRAYRMERDSDNNGVINIRDFVRHISGCR